MQIGKIQFGTYKSENTTRGSSKRIIQIGVYKSDNTTKIDKISRKIQFEKHKSENPMRKIQIGEIHIEQTQVGKYKSGEYKSVNTIRKIPIGNYNSENTIRKIQIGTI